MGSREWGMGNGEWGMGSSEFGVGSGESGAGREGNRVAGENKHDRIFLPSNYPTFATSAIA